MYEVYVYILWDYIWITANSHQQSEWSTHAWISYVTITWLFHYIPIHMDVHKKIYNIVQKMRYTKSLNEWHHSYLEFCERWTVHSYTFKRSTFVDYNIYEYIQIESIHSKLSIVITYTKWAPSPITYYNVNIKIRGGCVRLKTGGIERNEHSF